MGFSQDCVMWDLKGQYGVGFSQDCMVWGSHRTVYCGNTVTADYLKCDEAHSAGGNMIGIQFLK